MHLFGQISWFTKIPQTWVEGWHLPRILAQIEPSLFVFLVFFFSNLRLNELLTFFLLIYQLACSRCALN